MDGERKINLCEGVPLNTGANIFLNTGKNTNVNTPEGAIIHLKPEKPSNFGVHINTTFAIASSKKIKLFFLLNFLLSIISMVISCYIAFYYWNEVISMRKQIDVLRDQFILQNLSGSQGAIQQGALSRQPGLNNMFEHRQSRMDSLSTDEELTQKAKKFYVDDLGQDMLLVDSKKKTPKIELLERIPTFQKENLVVHFNGAQNEAHISSNSFIGPWSRDLEVSSKHSEDKIQLEDCCFTIKEGGLYLVYAQILYATKQPTYFSIFARQTGGVPRLLTTCGAGDDGSTRPSDKSQLSCSVQTVARLLPGDTVSIPQRDARTIWLRPGYSYFGFVKLSS